MNTKKLSLAVLTLILGLSCLSDKASAQVKTSSKFGGISGTVTVQGVKKASTLGMSIMRGETMLDFRLVNVNQNGSFSIPNLEQNGDVRICFFAWGHLQQCQAESLSSRRAVNIGEYHLRAGDANCDNTVDIFDLHEVISTYGSLVPNQETCHADFNYDGIVNEADLNLLNANFEESGDPLY